MNLCVNANLFSFSILVNITEVGPPRYCIYQSCCLSCLSTNTNPSKRLLMNTQKFLVSGIIGGIVSFFAGYLIYGIALMDFFAKNGGADSGVMRPQDQMIWWSLILGSLFQGLLFSYIFNRWASITTLSAGATAGAVLGLLIMAAHDFIMYATTNITNLTATIVDIIAGAVLGAIVGAAVGLANGMGTKKAA